MTENCAVLPAALVSPSSGRGHWRGCRGDFPDSRSLYAKLVMNTEVIAAKTFKCWG